MRSSRRPLALLAGAAVLTGLMIGTSPGASAESGDSRSTAAADPTYYVSLGDSLASGFQPDVQRDTNLGYTDKLFAQLKQTDPNLRHIKLGCSSETSATFINGGFCTYKDSANKTVGQLAKAVDFLTVNAARVKFVSLNIGGNDLRACFVNGAVDQACTLRTLKALDTNVGRITAAVNGASSATTNLAAANTYNPFLVSFLSGAQGQKTAFETAGAQQAFNEILARHFKANHFTLADFSTAFQSFAFTPEADLPGGGKAPANLVKLCQETFACGPLRDIHPTPSGHQLLADTMRPAL
ncbi:SGNH/GDSL hydrolase family protein [Streptomyces clavuligerus]|uniref:Lipolytic protein G-D-S-L family n=1 Tax=Streptomyces clavuligerus TaxID=1901 RepID=E2Q5Y8_STRCL|nr:SGNH/GDSL hydrolase family protein [Streptomyces clavuligerus]ANW21669.1 GDSL family lipase [Streptomyces clavuligerus]AXU16298.1 SGNH/GDSL hydrolase family protein [Streptomyces clavuligerus]EFG05148.1 Lipolytic protein G-D-S-L family [Streptomyces clavuligerus]MBY6306458.1 SGNH/GDSL hydrolase family protein [Streptomyces clavuligerus]QCS09077.1 SGNH/GDSL hydrolase family protein [Streptomyces clavuligerus]